MSLQFDIEARIDAVDWSQFQTAYGVAAEVPSQLRKLTSDDQGTAKTASHELWCGLCHQHAYLSTAALPAYPILFAILQKSNDEITVEILDILLGFADCSTPKRAPQSELVWVRELRSYLKKDMGFFSQLIENKNPGIHEFSSLIVENLSD